MALFSPIVMRLITPPSTNQERGLSSINRAPTTSERAQDIFKGMKNANGDSGEYGFTDHVYFNLGIHLKSVFVELSDQDKIQQQLYDAASKLKNASVEYFARSKEVALQYQKGMVKSAKTLVKAGIQDTSQLNYFKTLSLEKLATLQEVRELIEKDPRSSQARYEMLTNFATWSGLIKDGLANIKEADVKAEVIVLARENLLNEIGNGNNKEVVLQKIRMGSAYFLFQKHGVTDFIDKLESFVKIGVGAGLGTEQQVREDFIQMAAYTAKKSDLEGYFQDIKDKDFTVPLGIDKALQDHFNSKLMELAKGQAEVTVEDLKALSYQSKELEGHPIFLNEFFDENEQGFKGLANHLEALRRVYTQNSANTPGQAIKTLQAEMVEKVSIGVAELASVKALSNDDLKTILGEDAAAPLIAYREQVKEIEEVVASDVAYKALLRARDQSQAQLQEIGKQFGNAYDQLGQVGVNEDEARARIRECNRAFTKQSAPLKELNENLESRKNEIYKQECKNRNINLIELNGKTVNVSRNALVKLQPYQASIQTEGGRLGAAIKDALEKEAIIKKLNFVDLKGVITDAQAPKVYGLHQLRLYRGKIEAVTDVLVEANEQYQQKTVEGQSALGKDKEFTENFQSQNLILSQKKEVLGRIEAAEQDFDEGFLDVFSDEEEFFDATSDEVDVDLGYGVGGILRNFSDDED